MGHANKIRVLSANCQGLQTFEKRTDVLTYLRDTNASIVCLQDTHLSEKDLASIKQIWYNCYLHGTSTNSRGVLILLNNNFEHEVLEVNKDNNSNMLHILLKCGSIKINLINIYAPNQDNPSFFSAIQEIAQNNKAEYNVICGDFNLVLDPVKDCKNYTRINNPNSRKRVIEMMNEVNLVDIYRYLHPDTVRFSWRRRNPQKQARLDYFLVTSSMVDIIEKCDIKCSYRSDHSIVQMDISLSDFKIGKGIWKMNNSLLKNKDYLHLINEVIQNEKLKYALPVHSYDYMKKATNHINFSIDDDDILEQLFLSIRGETVKYATYLKKQNNQQEIKLIEDIKNLEKLSDNQRLSSLLEDKKIELENLRKEKVNGHITRSRIQWLSEGERPPPFSAA